MMTASAPVGDAPVLEARARESSLYSERRELYIGLVAALGTRLDEVYRIIREELRYYAYNCEQVRLSSTFINFPPYKDVSRDCLSPREYYVRAIDAGNAICESLFKHPSAMAQLGAWKVRRLRDEDSDPRRAICYVFVSLKRPDEVRQLREIYGSLFYCVGVYADESDRLDRMIKELHPKSEEEKKKGSREAAQALLDRDRAEGSKYGQNVQKAYSEADYFIRTDEEADLRQAVQRLLRLIFNVPYIGPTRSEIAMMHARTAALRSVDLARQVGAAIIARDGRVLTTGCNEVPKAGGGQYAEEDTDDRRDFQVGYDMNDVLKREAIEELLEKVGDQLHIDQLKDVRKAYNDLSSKGTFKDTRVDALIEFGRIVHAENAAINSSCMETISIQDCDLYCTTFPCHMCTRSIVNVGMRNVFYIEPYPKSAAAELYADSVVIDPKLSRAQYLERLTASHASDERVHFIAFEGVAPRRYNDLFGYTSKKKEDETGKAVAFDPTEAKPRQFPLVPESYLKTEEFVAESVDRVIARVRVDAEIPSSADGAGGAINGSEPQS